MKFFFVGCLGGMRREIKKTDVCNLRTHLTDSSLENFLSVDDFFACYRIPNPILALGKRIVISVNPSVWIHLVWDRLKNCKFSILSLRTTEFCTLNSFHGKLSPWDNCVWNVKKRRKLGKNVSLFFVNR